MRPGTRPFRIVYLIHNIQGVTGGNQTLLHHANALAAMGHDVTIVTYSEPPQWIALHARIVRVPVEHAACGRRSGGRCRDRDLLPECLRAGTGRLRR